MKFLVSVIDDGQAAAAGQSYSASEAEAAAIDTFNERLQAEGHWVYAGGLADTDTAKVVDNRGASATFTDGPFVESKEYLGGFWIIEAADLDAALAWAERGSRACAGKVEVRPFQDEPEA